MSSYSVSVRTSSTAPLTPQFELRTGALQATVYEIALVSNGAATGQIYILSYCPIRGISPSVTAALRADDPGAPAALSVVASAWAAGVPPPLPTIQPIRRYMPNNSSGIGTTIIWTFPRGLLVKPNSSLGVFNISLGSTMDIWIGLDE